MITVSPSQNWAPASAAWLHDDAALDALIRAPARLLGASASFLAPVLEAEDCYVSQTGLPPQLADEGHWELLASDRQDLLNHARHQALSLSLSAMGQTFEAVLH